MPRLTQSDFGETVGISGPAVSDLVKRNIIDLKKGKERSIVDYCAHLREKAAGRSGLGDFDLTEERARLSHHQANIAALDEAVKEKTLIPAEVVASEWQHIFGNIRARLLSVPTSLAASCAHATREQVQEKAQELIKQALEELVEVVEY